MEPRKKSKKAKIIAKGLFSGAKVVRGVDWKWGIQDGTQTPKTTTTDELINHGISQQMGVGKIVDTQEWVKCAPRSAVFVIWDVNCSDNASMLPASAQPIKNLYRVGYKGYMDLKTITPGKGYSYYSDHLPALGDKTVILNDNVTFNPNDLVNIDLDLEIVQSLQHAHGGWMDSMFECLGSTGTVVGLDDDLDVIVAYPSGNRWTLNPAILTKVDHSVEPCLLLGQNGNHPNNNNNNHFNVNRQSLSPNKKGTPSTSNIVVGPAMVEIGYNENDEITAFSRGDIVQIMKDVEFVKHAQKGHGEWADAMIPTLGQFGKVHHVYPDGDLKIEVNGVCWTFNPNVVKGIVSQSDIMNIDNNLTKHTNILQKLFDNHVSCNINEELVKAAAHGDLTSLREILSLNAKKWPPNTIVSTSSLAKNVKSNNQDAIVNVNGMFAGYAALHVACQNGHLEIVKILIEEQHCDPSLPDKDGNYPIHHCAMGDEPQILEYLLTHFLAKAVSTKNTKSATNINHHVSSSSNWTPSLIITSNHKKGGDVITTLDINARNGKQRTALHIAVLKGHFNIVLALLQWGAYPNLQDVDGDTPLHDAVSKNRDDILNLLLNYNDLYSADNTSFSNSQQCNKGNTNNDNFYESKLTRRITNSLNHASLDERPSLKNGHTPIFNISAKDLITTTNNNGFNVLHLAALRGNIGAVKIILGKLFDKLWVVDEKKDDGYTALHLAALNNHTEVVELLLNQGYANVNALNNNGQTPLHLAVEQQNFGVIKVLLSHPSCLIDIGDKDGDTPLHEAVRHHTLSQMKHLKELKDIGKLLIGVGLQEDPCTMIKMSKKSKQPSSRLSLPLEDTDSCQGSNSSSTTDKKSSAAIACYLISSQMRNQNHNNNNIVVNNNDQDGNKSLIGLNCLRKVNGKGQTPLDLCPDSCLIRALLNIATGFGKINHSNQSTEKEINSGQKQNINNFGYTMVVPKSLRNVEKNKNTEPQAKITNSNLINVKNDITCGVIREVFQDSSEQINHNDEQPTISNTQINNTIDSTKPDSKITLNPLNNSNELETEHIHNNLNSSALENNTGPNVQEQVIKCKKSQPKSTNLSANNNFENNNLHHHQYNKNMDSHNANLQISQSNLKKYHTLNCIDTKDMIDCGPASKNFNKNNNLSHSISQPFHQQHAETQLPLESGCLEIEKIDNNNVIQNVQNNSLTNINTNETTNTSIPFSVTKCKLNKISAIALNENMNNFKDVQKLQQQLQDIKEQTMCPVCLDRFKNMIFLCGHGTCQMCGDRMTECPICRTMVDKKILLY